MAHYAPSLIDALPSPLHAAMIGGGVGVLIGLFRGNVLGKALGYAAVAGIAAVAFDAAFGAGAMLGYDKGATDHD